MKRWIAAARGVLGRLTLAALFLVPIAVAACTNNGNSTY
jgi:hypothetical protein